MKWVHGGKPDSEEVIAEKNKISDANYEAYWLAKRAK